MNCPECTAEMEEKEPQEAAFVSGGDVLEVRRFDCADCDVTVLVVPTSALKP